MKLDHINYVVPNLKQTIEGYQKIGFKIIGEFDLHRKFTFISNGEVTYELFEDKTITQAYIGHIAYQSLDIEKDFEIIKKDFEITVPLKCIEGLFENGMEFFLFKGPNNEIIEYCKKR